MIVGSGPTACFWSEFNLYLRIQFRTLSGKKAVEELGSLRRKADFDIAQTLAVNQFGNSHHTELIGTCQQFQVAVATMSLVDSGKCGPRQKIHQLGEQRLASINGSLREINRKTARTALRRSNRHHPSSLGIQRS
jgi:hypothetical protein